MSPQEMRRQLQRNECTDRPRWHILVLLQNEASERNNRAQGVTAEKGPGLRAGREPLPGCEDLDSHQDSTVFALPSFFSPVVSEHLVKTSFE